jgi:DNA polymerase III sliding clamp (beta) subunit (PCNA family)
VAGKVSPHLSPLVCNSAEKREGENIVSTIEREGAVYTGLNYVEIEGEILLEILEGVSTHASKDKSLRTLNAVQIEGAGGDLIARSTDRYRLIEGAVRYREGDLEVSLISLDDIKKVLTLLKAHKAHLINITRIGDALTVSALGDAVTFSLVDGNYPPMQDLLAKSEGEPVAVKGVAFNPAFIADYAKIAGKGAPVKVYFTGEGKPMRVRITGDKITWRALLMPMRYVD